MSTGPAEPRDASSVALFEHHPKQFPLQAWNILELELQLSAYLRILKRSEKVRGIRGHPGASVLYRGGSLATACSVAG